MAQSDWCLLDEEWGGSSRKGSVWQLRLLRAFTFRLEWERDAVFLNTNKQLISIGSDKSL